MMELGLQFYVFLFGIFSVALLYASVGHGGASGYIALMTLSGIATSEIKYSSLLLNLLVSSISFFYYFKAGHFKFSAFYPYALGSIPAAFWGANLNMSDVLYKKILAIVLLFPILRMFVSDTEQFQTNQKQPKTYLMVVVGIAIGLVSGMLGIGGGILLSPLILVLHWAGLKETAATSALFIFVNSLSGFVVLLAKSSNPPIYIYPMILVAFAGAIIGGFVGSKKWNLLLLKRILVVVLLVAVAKLFFA